MRHVVLKALGLACCVIAMLALCQQESAVSQYRKIDVPRPARPDNSSTYQINYPSSGAPQLLVGVLSQTRNSAARDAIRNTWGADARLGRVVFLLAKPRSSEALKGLRQEYAQNGDLIILYNVEEHYRNITYQTLELFKLASVMPNITHVVKVDDDSYVRVGPLLQFLSQHPFQRAYIGCCMSRGDHLVRDPNAPNFVSAAEWKDQELPPYGWGAGYVLTFDLAVAVANVPHVQMPHRLLNLEDVSVGLWVEFVRQETGWQLSYIADGRINPHGCKKDDIISHKIKSPKTVYCMHQHNGSCC
jgi:hypothetical protein